MDKVSFQDAAKQAEVHFNTLRNWRKGNKLKTAEKVLENGRELWIVDPTEVLEIARQSRQGLPDQPANYHVDIDGVNPANDLKNNPPIPSNDATTGPGLAVTPEFEQTLVFMRESVVRPLVEANERQAATIGELKEEVGTLKERLRNLEEKLQAAQASHAAQVAPQPPPPAPITVQPVVTPQNAPQPKQGWRTRLARLFGGD